MIIKILGTGCPNCTKLKKNVEEAIEDLGLKDIKIEKIEEIDEIINLGVISTPGLIINDQLKTSGSIPDVSEIKKWLK
jgi:small redox-active disulfide protein 2